MYLVGDIGASKSRIATVYKKNNSFIFLNKKTFFNKDYRSLEEILKEFLLSQNNKLEKACFCVAGVVNNNICKMTNIFWEINAKDIENKFKIRNVKIINDLESGILALEKIEDKDLFVLNKGEKQSNKNKFLIMPGTGLGEACSYFATEGGHCDFAPKNDLEIKLFCFLKNKYQHVSYERILSGPGFLELCDFFRKESNPKLKAVNVFLSVLGSEAGNVGVKFLPYGGIFLAGSIVVDILKNNNKNIFLDSFLFKGRFGGVLSKIPVYLVLTEDLPLLGTTAFL